MPLARDVLTDPKKGTKTANNAPTHKEREMIKCKGHTTRLSRRKNENRERARERERERKGVVQHGTR